MKKLLLLALLAVGMTANAETFVTDDDEMGNTGGINLGKGMDDNGHWSMNFALGVNIPTDVPKGVEFAPFRSWEFNWTTIQYDYTPRNTKTTLSAGLGFDWRSYTLSGHKDEFFKAGDIVYVGPATNANDDFFSNIHTVSLSMPLLINQRFAKNFAISLGAQLNWNFYARIHNHMTTGDKEIDEYTKKIGERSFSVDVLGIVHLWDIGIYCKYSPMSVLKTDRGPEFKSFAVGVYF